MRGDHGNSRTNSVSAFGSPPHAWGSLQHFGYLSASGRFTPTCVGIMQYREDQRKCASVHPHMRGDHDSYPNWFKAGYGSPPHAWGSSTQLNRGNCHSRFTPTCVGIIPRSALLMNARPVHPHMRGDHVGSGFDRCRHRGSPPHAWGSFDIGNCMM